MIVLDEQLNDIYFYEQIQRWYKGKVINVLDLRINSVIKDDNIAALLHRQKEATFVTINFDDFWHKIPPHDNYCVVCIRMDGNKVNDLPALLRELLHMEQFNTKAKRMGLVISIRGGKVTWYNR